MSDIDNLQIKISADANKATNALNKLASSLTNFQRSLSIDTSKLTSISNSIQSIANAASSMNTSGIKNISTLTNSINRMGKIDTSGLSRISSALKTFSADMAGTKVDGVGDIASIASSISRLGGVASGRAITNIPLLAKNLKQLFTTLSTAPNVSENIIRMTNALAGLASTGAASGRAANSLGRNLNTYTASAKRATKSTFSLAAAFGKFYATYFLVIRGIKSLWKSIEGTTDYIEAFNYYTVAFNKVGKEWGKDFEKFGYDNAEDYAQSFGNRVNELLGKMSGLKVDVDGGLISESGMKNLGLNLQEITQYASQLASITNSLGQTGEVTTAISKSMTMLAGDISSLFNVDFSTVANNLQSGLIGQSRALYKYGIDITNATLQTYSYKYGIEKAVSEMSQAEKQQLRLLAILDQSKVSWGDLANTINSPSNMIRQFTNNVKEAGMVLGQLFIPVLQKVLPVINGVVIAIKRLLVSVANLLGIKIDFSSFGQGVSGYNENLEDTADALDKVGKSAKNAQSGIRAFDKLKVISTPKSSGSGSGAGGAGIDLTKEIMDATAEYEKVWQEAFDKMQNTAMGWADKVSKVFKPVKDIIEDLAYAFKFDSDAWFKVAGMDTSKLITGIFDWFTRAIDSVDWEKIGRHIGSFLAGIDWTAIFTSAGNFIKTAIDAAIDLWKGSFDAAPIETTILTAIGLLKFTGLGDILWKAIKDSIVLSMGGKAGAGIGETILGSLLGTGAATGAEGASAAGAIGLFGGISAGAVAATAAITSVVAGLALVYATNEDVRKSFKESISAIADNLTPAMEFLTTTVIPDLQNAWTGLVDVLTPIGEFLKTAFTSIWQDMLNPALKYVGEEVLPKLQSAFENLWNGVIVPLGTFLGNILNPAIQIVADKLTMLWQNVVVPLADALGSVLGAAFDAIVDTMNFVVEQVKPVIEVFNFLWDNVLSPIVTHLWEDLKPAFETVFNAIGNIIKNLGTKLKGLINFVSGVFTGNWRKAWDGIKDIFKGTFNNLVSIAEGCVNLIIDGINAFIDGFGLISGISEAIGISFKPVQIPKISIPRFDTGGYVPSRYTMFMAGENGVPEMLGTVNGKTAVAGGEEITRIRDAIISTAQQEIALLKQNNQLLQGILEKEFGITTDQIGIAARQYGQEQFNQKHKNVYVF
uniref:Minor tail protein n=1 Tax=Siphoviridae sp. ctLeh52 TaxID=2827849 RepID=A0A8S5RX63_9CAUD|nr:MAG TPA: minor tail protein [Siphoviridae sp. ctLeh52]